MARHKTNGQVMREGLLKYKGRTKTYKTYRNACEKMLTWAKEYKMGLVFNQKGIQAFEQYLEHDRGLSASTIHTYVAACCQVAGISQELIKEPSRTARTITRSHNDDKNMQGHEQASSGRFDRSVKFERAVGIRRDELRRLRGWNLCRDESGYLCVEVEKGKGGKYQLQRILPQDEERVISTFKEVREDERVFTRAELNNKIDYHGMRAEHAREAYQYYKDRLDQEPEYREQLRKELVRRWRVSNDRKHSAREFLKEVYNDTKYRCRGENKERLEELERPTEYDRTALLAVSVFHLSHWRNDVTVKNYM